MMWSRHQGRTRSTQFLTDWVYSVPMDLRSGLRISSSRQCHPQLFRQLRNRSTSPCCYHSAGTNPSLYSPWFPAPIWTSKPSSWHQLQLRYQLPPTSLSSLVWWEKRQPMQLTSGLQLKESGLWTRDHLLRELRSLMIGSTYLDGPAIPIIGVAASNLFLAQWVGRNFASGLAVPSDTFVKFPSRPYSVANY